MPQAPLQAKLIQSGPETIFDLGSKQSTASFSFKVNLAPGNDAFKTKASVDGRPAKAVANVNQFKLYLINTAAVPANDNGSGAIIDGSNTGLVVFQSVPIPRTAVTQTFTFKNVPANSPATNHFFVAIEAQENPGPVNIVNDTIYTAGELAGLPAGEQNRIRIDPDGAGPGTVVWAYRSNGGGDNENSFAGGIQVSATYTIPALQTDTLTTFLRVWGLTGATVDANVTVNNGDAGYMGSISVQ